MNQEASAQTGSTTWQEFFRPFNLVTLTLAVIGLGLPAPADGDHRLNEPAAREL
jgi:hypothetical protein